MSTIRMPVVVAALLALAPGDLAAQASAGPSPARGLARADLPALPAGLCAPDWEAAFGASPGVDDPVYTPGAVLCAALFDDGLGDGPVLFVGGRFTSAGGVPAAYVARWDGSAWSALGAGLQWDALAMVVWDDGGGDALYIGGDFVTAGGAPANRICKWDGSSFSALGAGVNDRVLALGTWSSLAGDKLVLGGEFTTAGGAPAQHIASWSGSAFAQVGDGLDGDVHAVTQFGPQLVAGGSFMANAAGTNVLPRLAGTFGANWATVGGGVNATVRALKVLDLGAGPKLHVGGSFTTVGSPAIASSRVAVWDGSWTSFGTSLGTSVTSLAAFDDGAGLALYVSGPSVLVLPNVHVARWTGSGWVEPGTGPNGSSNALIVHDDGSGESLWAVGQFGAAGDQASNSVARWDGRAWTPTGVGFQSWIYALGASTVGGGPAPGLFVGGYFNAPGMPGQNSLAWWKDGSYQPFGDANGPVRAFAEFDDGGGPALYVAGEFTTIDGVPANRVARWDGSTWSALGAGVDGRVHALCVFDDGGGPALHAAGEFTNAGGAPASRIAKWDGAAWSPLGAGLVFGTGRALRAWDDGTGPALYAAGILLTAFGSPGDGIARWDGASWSPVGTGLAGPGYCLALFDDGGGERLYVGGDFTSAGGAFGTANIAAWDGAAWAQVGGGVSNDVFALAVHDDGNGPALFAGGYFTTASFGSVPANFVARWDGGAWSPLGAGVDQGVFALQSIDDGTGAGPRLAVGGTFAVVPDTLPDAPASHLALWGGCWAGVNAWTDLGFALAGTGGDPLLAGTGSLALDSFNTVNLTNANPSAIAGLFLSLTSTPTPFAGGTLVPVPYLSLFFFVTSPLGEIPLSFVAPPGLPSGTTLFLQWAIDDPAAVSGVALSNALRGDVP